MYNDIQDAEGKWLRSYSVDKIKVLTKAGRLYDGMLSRCNPDGSYQQKNPTYRGCMSGFSGFQEFAEWCQKQVGYYEEDFVLDKDILFRGNKVYGPSTCVFVPQEINLLFKDTRSGRRECKIGVYYHSERKKFYSQITKLGKVTFLGRFTTEDEAHLAFKKAKEDYMKESARKWQGKIDNRVFEIMMAYQVKETD